MRRKRPVIKGRDTKRFKLKSEINELKAHLEVLEYKKIKTIMRIEEAEKELRQINNK